jgi:hypothetical protein
MLQRFKDFSKDAFKRAFNEDYRDQQEYRGLAELTGKFAYKAYDYNADTKRHVWNGIELPAHAVINAFSNPYFNVTIADPDGSETPLFRVEGTIDDNGNDVITYKWRGQELPGKPEITYGEDDKITVTVPNPADANTPFMQIEELPNAHPLFRVNGKRTPRVHLSDTLQTTFDM